MIGKNNRGNLAPLSLKIIFDKQSEFQKEITGLNLPKDDVHWYQYHITAIIEEIGEILKADKRWKTHRNTTYNREEKIDEIADLFVTCVNIALFSGCGSEEVYNAIINKIQINKERLLNAINSGGVKQNG